MSMTLRSPPHTDFKPLIARVLFLLRELNPTVTYGHKTILGNVEIVEPDPVERGVSIYTFSQTPHMPLALMKAFEFKTKSPAGIKADLKKHFGKVAGLIEPLIPILQEILEFVPESTLCMQVVSLPAAPKPNFVMCVWSPVTVKENGKETKAYNVVKVHVRQS